MSTSERIRKKKVVVEIDHNGKFIGFFESVQACADTIGTHQGVVSMILHRTRKHYHGRYFRFARPEEIEQFDKFQAKVVSEEQLKRGIEYAPIPEVIDIPEEVIPAVVPKSLPVDEDLSPFERMLRRSKSLE